jgi:DNA polymerase-3 subunit delta'
MLFKNIVGQSGVKKRLVQSANDGRVAHAQLFYGPQGSGALSLAIAYAQYLFCTNKQAADSCGACPSCIKFSKLIHPDLHFSFPIILNKNNRLSSDYIADWREIIANNHYFNYSEWNTHIADENKQSIIPADEASDILKKLSLTAYEGGYKMLIMWLPEKMNADAANRLLKLIEEPPDKTVFLFVTEKEEHVLRTIVSRTQIVKINRLADEEVKSGLIELKKINEADAARVAFLSDGDFSEALALTQNNDEADDFNFNNFSNWMRDCYTGRTQLVKILRWSELIAGIGRENQKTFLAYGINLLREVIMHSYTAGHLVKISGKELQFVKNFSPHVDANLCSDIVNMLNEASYQIERNANAKIMFTDLSVNILTEFGKYKGIKV